MIIALIIVAVALIAVSYIEIYQLKHITVAYEDGNGNIKGYAINHTYPAKEKTLDISEFESFIAKKKNLPRVRILQMQVDTEWKLRRL